MSKPLVPRYRATYRNDFRDEYPADIYKDADGELCDAADVSKLEAVVEAAVEFGKAHDAYFDMPCGPTYDTLAARKRAFDAALARLEGKP